MQSSKNKDVLRIQRMLIGHGALVLFYGGIIGFLFLFFLIGEVKLWPVPGAIDYQMPGTYDAWRMAHMEAIVNGLALWLSAAILPIMPFSAKAKRRVGVGLVITAWTIVIASTMDPLFPNSRGLYFGGNVLNTTAFYSLWSELLS